jgi:hypothetical protein
MLERLLKNAVFVVIVMSIPWRQNIVTNEWKHVSERLYDEHVSDCRLGFILCLNCTVYIGNSEIARLFMMQLEMSCREAGRWLRLDPMGSRRVDFAS